MSKKAMPTPFWQGQTFEIQTEDKEIYYTQFTEEKHDELHIRRPQDQRNMLMNIARGEQVTVFFFDIEEQGLFTFKTNIYILPDGSHYVDKPGPDSMEKAQRRRFFRVKIGVPMQLDVNSSDRQGNATSSMELFTHNISGGGVAFLHPRKITDTGEILSGILKLKTPSFQSDVPFKAKVISIVKTEHDVFRIALEFEQMRELERADIIKFCMFKQVELRNKLKNDRM